MKHLRFDTTYVIYASKEILPTLRYFNFLELHHDEKPIEEESIPGGHH